VTAPTGVKATTCRSCKAPIWFGLVWGTPCPMDVADSHLYPFTTTGRRRLPANRTGGARYVELSDRTESRVRWRIHRCTGRKP